MRRPRGLDRRRRWRDAELESLRAVFQAANTPAALQRTGINELMLLPDREAQNVRNKLLKAIEDWRASGPAAPPRAMVLEDLGEPAVARVFVRGNPNQLGDEVPRRFLRVLSEGEPAPFAEHDSGRLDLARAIVAADNPLTARVIVNRVWLGHFGAGLVRTPSDFGLRSEPPTHPELLDYLALGSFAAAGRSSNCTGRSCCLPRISSRAASGPSAVRPIPRTRWLWRTNRRRLDFESTRDALLAVAGQLENKLGGPPEKNTLEPAGTRRTLYGYIDRLNLPGLYRTFDFPNPDATSPERSQTTIPQQALFLLNNPLAQASAKHMLARSDVAGETDATKKIQRLVWLAYGREPAAEELAWAQGFLADAATRPAAWEEFAQALLMANEFVFVD